MSLGIVEHDVCEETHKVYDVFFYDAKIDTLVTHSPSMVDMWISDMLGFYSPQFSRLFVGLDVEWRPNNRYHNNPAATIQLCIGNCCLIFQLLYAPFIPPSLLQFLSNPMHTFVGVGIHDDVAKLREDYGLSVATAVDLRHLAAQAYGMTELRTAGLKSLARQVLGKEIEKPLWITMSRWDNQWLTAPQVQYACVDAFLSFEIGRFLGLE